MSDQLLIPPGKKVSLKKYDPSSTHGVPDREKADSQTALSVQRIGELQDILFAENKFSLLVILQGLDASGKDGTVRKVFDAVNPTGVRVTSFKVPTSLEARHDFLWRYHQQVPAHGEIGVFNRSYYEEVLVVRVHADKLLPSHLQHDKKIWDKRFALMNGFENMLAMNNTLVLKFFLHISKEEQRQRFLDRQKDPTKNWKLAAGDFHEREFWSDYQSAYEDLLSKTSTPHAPWHIIPANRKWVRNYHIARTIEKSLEKLHLQFPKQPDPKLIKMKFK